MTNERIVKVGTIPGRLQEFVVTDSTTISEVLGMANLDPSGYDVKVDANMVTDFNAPVGDANLIVLAKQVKGA